MPEISAVRTKRLLLLQPQQAALAQLHAAFGALTLLDDPENDDFLLCFPVRLLTLALSCATPFGSSDESRPAALSIYPTSDPYARF